ncbi:MAG: dihydropteroate synthase [Bacteroidales bacterium]|nr:dihydropteroate synthase [Bacteroidales bacterium]
MQNINIKGTIYDFSNPRIMGILNFTPDSFNPASRVVDNGEIKERIEKMFSDGADMIDIGGMSTRPNCEIISADAEWNRLKPALEIIAKHFADRIFSLDTFRAEIARRAITEYGISIVNDISAGDADSKMFEVVAETHAPYIIMHGAPNPTSLHSSTEYSSFINDILHFFSEKVNKLHSLGISDIIIDPGFGFSKTVEQNYELMEHLADFDIFDLPLLVGISRKSMIWKYLKISVEQSLNGTSILNTIALSKGANILRVHDVTEAVEALKICQKLNLCK